MDQIARPPERQVFANMVWGPTMHPLLGTTLHPLTPRLLLNVENGDYDSFLQRDFGCGLEKLGLTLHLHRIHSFEKFASEGMNYFYVDLFEILSTSRGDQ